MVLMPGLLQVPGLMDCVAQSLESDNHSPSASTMLGDVTPLGWFALKVALEVPGARADPLLPQLAAALKPRGGGAAAAAAQLEVLLAPQAAAEEGSGDNGGSSRAGGLAAAAAAVVRMAQQVVGLQDLRQYAGGRHDNDKVDYRDIQIMVTSEEVRKGHYLCAKMNDPPPPPPPHTHVDPQAHSFT
jgi:hypothetical protein